MMVTQTVLAAEKHLQPIVDAIARLMLEKNLSKAQMCAALYGRDDNGKTIGSGVFYPVIKGAEYPPTKLRMLFREKFGLELEGLVPADSVRKQRAVRTVKPKPVVVSARAALEAFTQSVPPSPLPPPPRKPEPPRFAMSIDQEGFASVTYNATGLSADQAIRVLGALQAAELINTLGEG